VTPTAGRLLSLSFAVLAGAGLASAGCARQTVPPAGTVESQPATESVQSSTGPMALANLDLKLVKRWPGFSEPVYLTNAGDGSGRLFVVEQGGLVKIVSGGSVLDRPYLDVRDLVSTGGERGLLGVAFAPGFKTNGRLYVNYTDVDGNTRVARYTSPDPASNEPTWGTPREVLSVKQPYANHNGGGLQFGPDRMLYVGMGDGGSGGDPQGRAQKRRELLGKMLRLDVGEAGTAPPNGRYAIPADNPFVGDASTRPEIWSLGLRNPWRYSFDTSGGALWIGDVGQNEWEEIDYAPAATGGQNWGWNLWEGDHRYPAGAPGISRNGFTFPVLEYPHPTGESVTGGYVYRGSRYPALAGTYLYADFTKGWIGGIRLDSADGRPLEKPEERVLAQTRTQPSSFGVDEAGELYLVDYNGIIWSVTATAK
jgi:glucose/arabinose dehydrogenase